MRKLLVAVLTIISRKLQILYQKNSFISFIIVTTSIVLIICAWLGFSKNSPVAPKREKIYINEFWDYLEKDRIERMTVFQYDREIWGELSAKYDEYVPFSVKYSGAKKTETEAYLDSLGRVKDRPLIGFDERVPKTIQSYFSGAFWMILGIGVIGLVLWFVTQHNQQVSGQQTSNEQTSHQRDRKISGIGDKRLRSKDRQTTFADVGGAYEAKEEVGVIIEFLQNQEKFSRVGAKMTNGVLLVGFPGTGKTLLARAVAGEAGRPFFAASGAEFVRIYVGSGASRVRDFFDQAKEHRPCVVFIDDIDSVGRARSENARAGGAEEYDSALIQLLDVMDGIENSDGIVVIGATNAPKRLDPALVRPGRFDKQIVIHKPDVREREEILQIHARNVPLSKRVDLGKLARGVPGFVGADLALLVNEAATLAGRQEKKFVSQKHFLAAKDRVILGSPRRILISDEEKKILAFHEGGHALVAIFSPGADPVEKVTIIPHGRSLGLTLQIPQDDQHIWSREYCLVKLRMMMGGRVGEKLATNDLSTGAGDDLTKETFLAQQMVCEWGMSDVVGPVVYRQSSRSAFLDIQDFTPISASETKRCQIEQEVESLIRTAEKEATDLITKHKARFNRLVKHLIKKETLDGDQVYKILEKKYPN
ncbi:ATP-dependent zinc metalloprotease FtsH [Patescibacteria group bacterium AH-259-L05]|nr:ATP-dependent zinc metalloprotease FtsH [Patescibacteria group bacterium AH-259-L05]